MVTFFSLPFSALFFCDRNHQFLYPSSLSHSLLFSTLCIFSSLHYHLPRGFASSAGSEDDDEDLEGMDPAVKVVKEKERRQANNARER